MTYLSIREAYVGKNVLLSGASGFLGKVWLSMVLDRMPEIGRVYILTRYRNGLSAHTRLERIFSSSPAFSPLQARLGEDMSQFVSSRVEVVQGDIAQPSFGMDEPLYSRLLEDVDLVVNCAGLVDFFPELGKALSVNVDGALHAAEFVRRSSRAALLHVSTIFVSGQRQGRIEETLKVDETPAGISLNAETEYREAREAVERIADEYATEQSLHRVRQAVIDRFDASSGILPETSVIEHMCRQQSRRDQKAVQCEEGRRRSESLGWSNTYLYVKALAEKLIATRYPDIRWATFRPSIIESAREFPFEGWNEGFNTSGPLTFMIGGFYPRMTARGDNPFDVIPVDEVCKGMITVGAALICNVHRPVYHCGTSDSNCFTVAQALELTNEYYRLQSRENPRSVYERLLASRRRTRPSEPDSILSVPKLKAASQVVNRVLDRMTSSVPPAIESVMEKVSQRTEKFEKQMDDLAKIERLFKPFVYDMRAVFSTDSLRSHRVEEQEFEFRPESIRWRDYWIRVQMPGLSKWCFPIFKGKRPRRARPLVSFELARPHEAVCMGADGEDVDGESIQPITASNC